MTNPATETFGQARQGSVAAIIQVLNESLALSGIRTRAVVAEGMLQLLCEAATPEQLERSTTVERVRTELETISPQRIKKVKINSRIVKEEQLLWLEEINRDPDNALLWSEIITLKRPFFVKRWIRDRNLKPAGPIFKDITDPEPEKGSLTGKLIGGVSLLALIAAAAWLFREDLPSQPADTLIAPETSLQTEPDTVAPDTVAPDIESEPTTAPIAPPPSTDPESDTPPQSETATEEATATSDGDRAADTTPIAPTPTQPSATETAPPTASAGSNDTAPAVGNTGSIADAFAEAVRIAEKAAIDGQTATTKAQWLDLAARWQKAADLMGNIPAGNEQYDTAQDRIPTYQTNSQSALKQANAATAP